MEYSWRAQVPSLEENGPIVVERIAARSPIFYRKRPLHFRLLRRGCRCRYGSGRSHVNIFRRGLRGKNLLFAARGWRGVDVDRFVEFVLDFAGGFLEFLD